MVGGLERIVMSGPLANAESVTQAATAVATKERRQVHRVDVSLRVRIKPADATSHSFEDAQMTLNASRKAFYFFTPLECYRPGMRVLVTRLYGGDGAGAWEDRGQVIRVHRRDGGYGVVVQLETPSHLAKSGDQEGVQTVQLQDARPVERRKAGRKPFTAATEVIDLRSGSRMLARVSDLSLRGCYVDTLNPFPVGSKVRLQIYRANEALDVPASVRSLHPSSGMGLTFEDMTQEQRMMLYSWLAGPPTLLETQAPTSRRVVASQVRAQQHEACAARLVQMLVRKGVLSQSEAVEVLDPDSKS
jgi:hypothetical protein